MDLDRPGVLPHVWELSDAATQYTLVAATHDPRAAADGSSDLVPLL